MNLSKTVCVIVPTYNRANYICECIDSILAQTLPAQQIIVVNDGSTDNSLEVLESFGDKITILNKSNGGKAQALNHAIPMVKSDYIWIFDDDDVALPTSIESRLNILEKNPDISFVYSTHFIGHNSQTGKITKTSEYKFHDFRTDDFFYQLLVGCFFTLQSMLIRTSVLRTTGLFDETLLRSQDYDMMIRLTRFQTAKATDQPTFIFRHHQGVRGPEKAAHSHKEKELVWLKYDQKIGAKVRQTLELKEYLPRNQQFDKRLALLKRMNVMSSKGLISEMIEDLNDSLKVSNVGLTHEETHICRQAACNNYFVMRFFEGGHRLMRNLRDIPPSIAKRHIMRNFSKSIFWVARSGHRNFKLRIKCLVAALFLLFISLEKTES